MSFRDWLWTEAGHFSLAQPTRLRIVLNGEEKELDDIVAIDPRLEYMKLKLELPEKGVVPFMGQFPFSLPLSRFGYINTIRDGALGGRGFLAREPQPVILPKMIKPTKLIIPQGWADNAILINSDGEDATEKAKEKKLILPRPYRIPQAS